MEKQQEKKSTKKSTIVKAVLAGGLVLGVGGAITLAAWTGNEFATGTFTSGSFGIEGSTVDTNLAAAFSSHAASPGATLSFSLENDNVSPNNTYYQPYALRTASGTATQASITASIVSSGAFQGVSYALYDLGAGTAGTAFTCDADSIVNATTLIPTTSLAVAVTEPAVLPLSSTLTLAAGTSGASPTAGAPENLCWVVTTGDTSDAGLAQNASSTAIWQFTAAPTN